MTALLILALQYPLEAMAYIVPSVIIGRRVHRNLRLRRQLALQRRADAAEFAQTYQRRVNEIAKLDQLWERSS